MFEVENVDLGGIDFGVWRIKFKAKYNYTKAVWC